MAGALLAWFLSVLLTRTYERWYRAADKHTIVITIVILYALTGVMLVQSHNLKAFVSEHNLSLDRQIAAEYPYTNITLDDAIRLNKKFDAEVMKNQYYDRCVYVEKGSKWWCKFKDMNKSASASILIIGNCWAPNHARIIHESCKNRSRVMTLYGYPGCDVLVETSKPNCKTTFAGYVQYIKETTPDYLFVIVKYQQYLTEQSESVNGESFVKQFYTRTQSLQKLVKRRIFILDILPQFIPNLVCVLNSKLSQQKIFNQTELLHPFPVDFTRSVLRKAIASCEKCTLISYDDVFGNGSSFRFFDENTKVTFFAGHHISPYGLRKVAPIYEKICASF
ncbi:hypothetical protein Q1695_008461 [Nippostrongylus brasiliensis]|nr:hypothetical protein Q1695_008461 [Nippostrongylus brasiliensis]